MDEHLNLKKLSEEIENLPEEDHIAIYYWYKKSHGLFLVLKDDNGKKFVVFNAHCELEDWEHALGRPDKGIDYEKDILEKMKEDKWDAAQEMPKDKKWMKTGLKNDLYVIPADGLCIFAIFQSLPGEGAGLLLQNTDTRETESGRKASGQKHYPISAVARWVLTYLNDKQKKDLQSVAEDCLKAGKDDTDRLL